MSDELIELETTVHGTASLGAVIDALKTCRPTAEVQYDFCYLRPTTLESYRGHYDHLALGWTPKSFGEQHFWVPILVLIAYLEEAIGKEYEGWKGGDYVMSRETPLWVANPGETGGTGIVAIEVMHDGKTVVLVTKRVD
jgi:hypothetical protein